MAKGDLSRFYEHLSSMDMEGRRESIAEITAEAGKVAERYGTHSCTVGMAVPFGIEREVT